MKQKIGGFEMMQYRFRHGHRLSPIGVWGRQHSATRGNGFVFAHDGVARFGALADQDRRFDQEIL
ncbi:MAG: hypothetical protein R2856_17835 [Caldilineaceae bacterium]